MKKEKTNKKSKLWLVAVVIGLMVAVGACSDDTDAETSNIEATIEDESVVTLGTETTLVSEIESEAIETTIVPAEETEVEDNLTLGQKNALKSALSYLDFSAFSHSGLIGQLEFEGYTTEEATFAADNCGADWNEQALKSALSYLDYSAFSYTGLIDQLEYEGYTNEQAVYGADNCGADWNEQAAKTAESYLEYSSFSRAELIDQLEYEGYTPEQAEYAVTQVGY